MPEFTSHSPAGSPTGRTTRLVAALLAVSVLLTALGSPVLADLEDDYNLALQFYKQDRWDFAAAKLQSFLKEAPGDHPKVPLAKLYLGQALVHQRKFREARPIFRDFVANYPQHEDRPLAMYRVAEASYFLDEFKTARGELEAFLTTAPAGHVLAEWALQYLGETELELEDYDAARKTFTRALAQFPDGRLSEELKFGLARSLDGLGKSDESRELYRKIADANGRRAADAQFNLAAALFEEEKYSEAASHFQSVVDRFSDSRIAPLAALNAGYSHYHLGEFSEAMDQFDKVLEDPSLGPTAVYWKGLSLKSLEKWNEAATTLLSQFEKDDAQPLAESLLFHAADARLGEENYAESLRLFREVYRRWPEGEMADDALHLATEAAILNGDIQTAQALDEQFSKAFPNSGLRYPQDLLSGRLLLARGDQLARDSGSDAEPTKQQYRDAAEAFTRVLENSTIEETRTLARLQLARAWDRLGNHRRVLETLQPLIDVAPEADSSEESRIALAMQSTALLSLERHKDALAAAESYLQRPTSGPELAEAWANVALANAALESWSAAGDALQKLRGAGNVRLADRVAYELAEAAYDSEEWTIAETYYRLLVDRGPQGEFYRPAVSGLAYSLHEQGRTLQKQMEHSPEEDSTGTLAGMIAKFDDAARWFERLAELSSQQDDLAVQSDAQYMRGVSLKLARRLPLAASVLMETATAFELPENAERIDETIVKAALNAQRAAKEAARVYQELQKLEDAEKAYQTAFAQSKRLPSEHRTHLDRLINEWALMHYNADDFSRANELFRLLAEEQPDSPWADDARLLIAEHQYFNAEYDKADDALQSLLKEEATDDFVRERALVLQMDIAARRDRWEQVRDSSSTLVTQFPEGKHHWEAKYRLGEASLRLDDLDRARTIFQELAAQNENQDLATEDWYPGVWLMLAETHLRLKEYDQVSQVAAQFGELQPDSPLSYHLDVVQGRSLQNQARFAEARAAFSRVLESPHGKGTETAAKAQLFIAETYFLQKQYEKAFEEYYRVLLYGFPEWQSAALLQAGKSEELLKRWQGAAKSYRQLLEEHPDSNYAEEAQTRLRSLEKRFPETVGR